MSNFLYSLEKYKNPASNIECSGCGQKRMRPYVNNATGERLGNHVGRCERSDECQYHFTPKQFFEQNPESKPSDLEKWTPVPPPPRPTNYIDKTLFKSTLGFNEMNTFHRFLVACFGQKVAFNLIDKYYIGTNTFTKNKDKARLNRTIFWQVDLEGRVRTGQCVKYNATKSEKTVLKIDCKRDKNENYKNYFCHQEAVNYLEFNLSQCLFGHHLLLTDNRTVAIVEAAKTAVISSVYFPQYVWLSCEGKEGLNLNKLKVLKGRNVVLFPDLSKITEKKEPTAFEKWTDKSIEMKAFCKSVIVSDFLEKNATAEDRANGADLADCLLRFPLPELPTEPEPCNTVTTDAQSCVIVNSEVVDTDLIAIHYAPPEVEEIPFWEDVPQISDVDFKRNCEVLDWWNKRLDLPIDGTMNIDGVTVHDIKDVITKHLKIIHSDNSSAVLSLKFLEKIKKSITR